MCVRVYVCVYLTCSSGGYFKKRVLFFLKRKKRKKKKCCLGHLTISEALAVHAGVIERVLIPK